jgi:GTP-binding protein Era
VKISKRLQGVLRDWPWTSQGKPAGGAESASADAPDQRKLGRCLRQMTEQLRVGTTARDLGGKLKDALGRLSDRLSAVQASPPEGPDAAWAQASEQLSDRGQQGATGERGISSDSPHSAPPSAAPGGQRGTGRQGAAVVESAPPAKAGTQPRHAGRRSPRSAPAPVPTPVKEPEAGDKAAAGLAEAFASLVSAVVTTPPAAPKQAGVPRTRGDAHLDLARESLRDLVEDRRVPPEVREALAEDYTQVEAMLEKLDQGHIHVAAFGRVGVGKSATLNALLGEQRFTTSPLHGETKSSQMGRWEEYNAGGIFLVDTPGLNEVEGEERERLAHEVAARSDLVLFVVDGDLTDTEIRALRVLTQMQRPIVLVFNKVDRYTREDRTLIVEAIALHTAGFIDRRNIVCISAMPAERLVITVDEAGREAEAVRLDPPDIADLRMRLWDLLETEGKTLAALNASLFASNLSDQVAQRILKVKHKLGARLIRSYCIAKGVAVALNPIPVADLLAALAVDAGLVVHLSRLYGLPLSRREAGSLVKVIATQMTLLMGTVWVVNLISAALKLGTGGLSTVLTGTAQGAVAYYSTFVVGQAAEVYLAQGKSWGELGPKQVIRGILDGIDRDSVLSQARSDIAGRLWPRGSRPV